MSTASLAPAALAAALAAAALASAAAGADPPPPPAWKHLSSAKGDLPVPMPGKQQTACLALDVDKDGVCDLVITERTATPSVVWLRRTAKGWDRYVIDDTRLAIEAGGAFADIDGDGDLDLVFGGDGSSNQVWWWENPHPAHAPDTPWKRRLVKDAGAKKHHHQAFGDFDGDGRPELVFWNQGAKALCLAPIPADPKATEPWSYKAIYTWDKDREHEGLAVLDVDGDGRLDIVGGGNGYRNEGGHRFTAHLIDAEMRFTLAAAGHLVRKTGGRPEVVFSPGDADGPVKWYAWDGRAWVPHVLLEKVVHGHSLQVADIDGDGNLDVFVGEMGRWGNTTNPDPKVRVFYGDGRGAFREQVVARGAGSHESKVADLDGDGRLDILGKPYNLDTPRVDVWLNQGRTP